MSGCCTSIGHLPAPTRVTNYLSAADIEDLPSGMVVVVAPPRSRAALYPARPTTQRFRLRSIVHPATGRPGWAYDSWDLNRWQDQGPTSGKDLVASFGDQIYLPAVRRISCRWTAKQVLAHEADVLRRSGRPPSPAELVLLVSSRTQKARALALVVVVRVREEPLAALRELDPYAAECELAREGYEDLTVAQYYDLVRSHNSTVTWETRFWRAEIAYDLSRGCPGCGGVVVVNPHPNCVNCGLKPGGPS